MCKYKVWDSKLHTWNYVFKFKHNIKELANMYSNNYNYFIKKGK